MRIQTFKFQFYFYLFFVTLFIVTCTNPFFWDTIHLASMQAHFYYENSFSHFLLPEEMDSGHPPLLSLLLAASWKLFGRSLLVSHLLMLPFILLMVHQVLSLCKFLFGAPSCFLASGLIVLNTTLLAQTTLVSPDVILYCFFFLTLNGIYRKKILLIIIGAIFLSMVSMRGMMCAFALCIFQSLLEWKNKKKIVVLLRSVILYLPAGLLSLVFLYFHYSRTGWIGYHSNSPWMNAFEKVGISGILRNVLILGWRFVDFGNIFIWVVFGWGILRFAKKPILYSQRSVHLLWLFVICLTVLIAPQLFYKFLLSHRYLFPVVAVATLFIFSIASENIDYAKCRNLAWIAMFGMITGNLWVYPDKIAKGWDSTLGHLGYYKNRREMLDFINKNHLDPAQIGAAFPYESDSKYIDLSNDLFAFAPKNLSRNRYILYSNVANDFTDEELITLKKTWNPLKQVGNWPIRFILYERPSR